MAFSKTQIDKLGDRLKAGSVEEQDLRDLDEYRRSFGTVYEGVRSAIHLGLGYLPTGRPAKTTQSIVAKLRRESIRLSQIQDIAGCRIVVVDLEHQDEAVRSLMLLFPHAKIDDRREEPSHGYRAVHLIGDVNGKLIELQVRTVLQHLWAQVSEKLSDMVHPDVKYGGGPAAIAHELAEASMNLAALEYALSQPPVIDASRAVHEVVSRLLRLIPDSGKGSE